MKVKEDKIIKGTIARWDSERGWHDRDGGSIPSPLYVVGTRRVLQWWKGKELYDERTEEPLPNPNDLNVEVPQEQWELDMNGKPKPPWALFHVVYLFDAGDAGVYTHINSTAGTAIAVERLEERIAYMQALRGEGVRPMVRLGDAPMRTRFGMRTRPNFEVVKDEWREFAGGRLLPGPAPVVPQLTSNGGNGAGVTDTVENKEGIAKYVEIKKVGKKVKEVSLSEELDDEIPI
jgi:hypothetical protein